MLSAWNFFYQKCDAKMSSYLCDLFWTLVLSFPHHLSLSISPLLPILSKCLSSSSLCNSTFVLLPSPLFLPITALATRKKSTYLQLLLCNLSQSREAEASGAGVLILLMRFLGCEQTCWVSKSHKYGIGKTCPCIVIKDDTNIPKHLCFILIYCSTAFEQLHFDEMTGISFRINF